MREDDEEFDYPPAPTDTPTGAMIPVKQFTAFTADGEPIEIVGVHYHDEETNFVAIVTMEDEIFPQVIHYSVYKNND